MSCFISSQRLNFKSTIFDRQQIFSEILWWVNLLSNQGFGTCFIEFNKIEPLKLFRDKIPDF